MEPVPQEVLYYKTANGREPFRDWFLSLQDARVRQKIEARLARVRSGNFGDCHFVGSGVVELRVHFGPGYRIYFGRLGNQVIVLLAGGDKQSQTKDIERAQIYWNDYRSLP
jgi:putative addiction module killer protein